MSRRIPTSWPLLSLCIALHGVAAFAQAPSTTVRGQVTDSATRAPLAGAEVYIAAQGATAAIRGARTNASGQYSLAGVPSGAVIVRVRMVGYAPGERRVTVGSGDAATVDFPLSPRLTQLDQVVVTGTGGETQRRAVGNVIESINAAEVLKIAPARSVEQLIGARTPGVIVLPSSGQVGTGAQVRVRGVSSLSLSNDPIIYIDGVRMDASSARGPARQRNFAFMRAGSGSA